MANRGSVATTTMAPLTAPASYPSDLLRGPPTAGRNWAQSINRNNAAPHKRSQKKARSEIPLRASSIQFLVQSDILQHFDDRLSLNDHLVFIEEMEALHQQLMAAAFNIQNA